jgi:poly-gamma-glutamate synthesis protein (capsule biosynthesis protein)
MWMAASAFADTGVARVTLVGDVMLAASEGTGRFMAAGGDPFEHIRSILMSADLRVANFESSAGSQGQPDPQKPYSFRTAPAAVSKFAEVFNVAGLANNHAGDFGRSDFLETIATLKKAGVTPFGGGGNPTEAHRAATFTVQGVKIALLGYLDFFPRWFAAAPGMPGVAWLDQDQVALDINKAKADGADVVIVVPHWGIEHEPVANDRQRKMAKAMIDAGADAIVGGHPHVVQDSEIYKDKPIIYSLGNFVFDGFEDEDNITGWMLSINVDKVSVRSLETHVVRMDLNGSPVPQPNLPGPCWERGQKILSLCSKVNAK